MAAKGPYESKKQSKLKQGIDKKMDMSKKVIGMKKETITKMKDKMTTKNSKGC